MASNRKKKEFKLPYLAVVDEILYGENGDLSMTFSIRNPVIRYAADTASYYAYHHLLGNLIKILGEGYILQKEDIFFRSSYQGKCNGEFLQQKYNEHFEGRVYTQIRTYLTVTRRVKRDAFYVYDPKVLTAFRRHQEKIMDLLKDADLEPQILSQQQINRLMAQTLGMEFTGQPPVWDNLICGERQIDMGSKAIRSISLVDTDEINLPAQVSTYKFKDHDKGIFQELPEDNLAFLYQVPDYCCMIYNQVIEIPPQQATLHKLQLKRKRHSGVPDPANNLCVADIDQLLVEVARDGQPVVNVHYNLVICAESALLDKAANFVEASLFQQGIVPNRNAYNQLELFQAALPGNAVALKKYDWLLTTCDAALCYFFKERLPESEISDFVIRFTDRQGIPICIDPSDLAMQSGRISNRSKFCLGGSGTGKSFFMCALLEQYMLYNMDVVIIDTGHSYSGLCAYYQGKYITWTENNPITMNPFAISAAEFNIEKKDFLCTLVGLLWKGADGTLNSVEYDVISQVINSYYFTYFNTSLRSGGLSFDTFYEFAVKQIPQIKEEEQVPFDLDEFRYVLKKFYKGGEYQAVLNEAADDSLMGERFIVFEIDNIKENRVLFPVVTLIIMDVFLQKMRHREFQRKALIVEEAWKAVSSPLMADYLLYLYKTVRKFWGEAIVVTQELGDILGNAVIKDSILANSDTICLLDQGKFRQNYAEVAKLLSLSKIEEQKIFTINQLDNRAGRGRFKEVYIKRGTVGEVYGVEVSIYQYLTYTTEKPEKLALQTYVKAHGSYQAALEAFVSDMQQSGLTLDAFVTGLNQAKTLQHG
ncbi:TraG family conjugative transposon ATPase [Mucilaginibacter sabulilitoris]|uniref:TraG family conjugative transposon ATPase n=1 Tax=Mucilaginibacter sabulilitoris TaxID=1173583 RepID=A0ABZ0TTG6_9SPHI|nr:TraG family conjugative transposon ATPase [Mucilaginibacter sabulilitoris]WPU95767.1 TraG family conjugative transposon ATPase [Mucilaginibacter sabulilitoris]